MATFDMSFLEGEPLVFKNLYGNDYTIPASVPVEFVLKLSEMYKKTDQIKDENKQFEVMLELVTEILKLDESQEASIDDVRKFSVKALKIVIQETMKQINNIEQDPNSDSPSSK